MTNNTAAALYQHIITLQDYEADEVDAILLRQGEDKAIAYLARWDYAENDSDTLTESELLDATGFGSFYTDEAENYALFRQHGGFLLSLYRIIKR